MLGGAALVSAALFQKCYAAREAMVVVAGLGVVSSAVFLLLALSFHMFRGAAWIYSRLWTQSQRGNRESGEWAFAIIQPPPATARSTPRMK
jgi:hypothetical protein